MSFEGMAGLRQLTTLYICNWFYYLFGDEERMQKMRISVSIALVVIAVGFFFSPAISTSLGEDIDYEVLASKFVNTCANIKEGDLVVVSGGVRDMELLENIAVHVRTLGAFPLVTLGSDRMTRRMYDDVPVKYDSQTPEFSLKLAEIIDAVISVDNSETMGLLRDIPAERMALRSEAFIPVSDIPYDRNVRQVSLGDGMYPIADRAAMYGLSLEQLADVFWKGVNVDYTLLQAIGESVRCSFAAGKEEHITNLNGTDLKEKLLRKAEVLNTSIRSGSHSFPIKKPA
jgi:leucyl aminopeptidase (aminopeptidase T)